MICTYLIISIVFCEFICWYKYTEYRKVRGMNNIRMCIYIQKMEAEFCYETLSVMQFPKPGDDSFLLVLFVTHF